MKTRILVAFAALILPSAFFCQQIYVPGYIVNATGDTLRGQVKINEKKPLERYAKVMFKDEKGMQRTYRPAKIKAYGFEGNDFVSLNDNGEPVFFKALVQGPIGLYELMYEGLRMNKVITESEYFVYLSGDKSPEAVKDRNFRKQLADLTEDKPEIAEAYPDEKEFNLEAALEAITTYNAWKTGENKE